MIVAHCHQNTAMGRCARHVGMTHDVAGPVHPGPLAVPKAENTIELAFATQLRLLCTPECCGRQIFRSVRTECDICR